METYPAMETQPRSQLKQFRQEQRENQQVLSNIERDKRETPKEAKAAHDVYEQWEKSDTLPASEQRGYASRRIYLESVLPAVVNWEASTLLEGVSEEKRKEILDKEVHALRLHEELVGKIVPLEEQNYPSLFEGVTHLAKSMAQDIDVKKLFTLPPEACSEVLRVWYVARAIEQMVVEGRAKEWTYAELGLANTQLMGGAIEMGAVGMLGDGLVDGHKQLLARMGKDELDLFDGDEIEVERLAPTSKGIVHRGNSAKMARIVEVRFMIALEKTVTRELEKDTETDLMHTASAFLDADGKFRTFLTESKLFPTGYDRHTPASHPGFIREVKEHFAPLLKN